MRLIALRHGPYSRQDGSLTLEGQEKITQVCCELKQRLNGDRVMVITSPQPRAEESGVFLAAMLGASDKAFIQWPMIDSDVEFCKDDYLMLFATFKSLFSRFDTLIVVGHGWLVNSLPIRLKMEGFKNSTSKIIYEFAEGIIADYETKEVKEL